MEKVEFYRDSDYDRVFDDQQDELVGVDGNPINGFFWFGRADFPYGEQTFFARAEDNEGIWSQVASVQVEITNVAPEITDIGVAPSSTDENGQVEVSVAFRDPGADDAHAVYVEWGDGTTDSFDLPQGARTFARPHRYLDDNPSGTVSDRYPISVTVSDNAGGSDTETTSVRVDNVAPAVGGFSLDRL